MVFDGWSIPGKIAIRWMSLDLTDNKSTLVQIMAWCRQATSHYLSQCWPRSMSSHGVNRPQWVECINNNPSLTIVDGVWAVYCDYCRVAIKLVSHLLFPVKCINNNPFLTIVDGVWGVYCDYCGAAIKLVSHLLFPGHHCLFIPMYTLLV